MWIRILVPDSGISDHFGSERLPATGQAEFSVSLGVLKCNAENYVSIALSSARCKE